MAQYSFLVRFRESEKPTNHEINLKLFAHLSTVKHQLKRDFSCIFVLQII
ncbi:hypothetical protein NMS_2525 [Nonlabens marinus S1-08]|uniref:Uncharacterized protein n=1 Tax=Nonlabens marinus S1-08 TaxID=1454201 RepID=W8VRX4_9FLAO|nr:hypothetical protein NMS_2525 [Nonlabens marinus S1-08]